LWVFHWLFLLFLTFAFHHRHDLLNVDELVPDIEMTHARHTLHQPTIFLDTPDDCLPVLLSREAIQHGRHHDS
jgi:hypothetical protein